MISGGPAEFDSPPDSSAAALSLDRNLVEAGLHNAATNGLARPVIASEVPARINEAFAYLCRGQDAGIFGTASIVRATFPGTQGYSDLPSEQAAAFKQAMRDDPRARKLSFGNGEPSCYRIVLSGHSKAAKVLLRKEVAIDELIDLSYATGIRTGIPLEAIMASVHQRLLYKKPFVEAGARTLSLLIRGHERVEQREDGTLSLLSP